MSNYREMLEDYRDLDIDELMKGMSEAELLALDEELERDVIQPNPSYSLRAPTPPPPISDDDSRYFNRHVRYRTPNAFFS